MSTFTPISITPADPDRSHRLPSLRDFFSPGGVLAQSSLAFEHRPGQFEMAKAVERALTDKRHLIVEAGTGTGKTLAYLLPALRMARERQQRVILSTGTKNLQEQLYFKDVPFLESVLGEKYGPLKVCYMKGRANLPMPHKLYALRAAPLLNGLEEISQFHAISAWEKDTETGDRAEIGRPARALATVEQARRPHRGLPGPDLPRLGALLRHRHAPQGARVRPGHRQPPPLLRRSLHQAAIRQRARCRHPA